MSHSLNVVRMAAVCWAMTSCAAILRRSGDMRLRVKRSLSVEAGDRRRFFRAIVGSFGRRPPFGSARFARQQGHRLSLAGRPCRCRQFSGVSRFSSPRRCGAPRAKDVSIGRFFLATYRRFRAIRVRLFFPRRPARPLVVAFFPRSRGRWRIRRSSRPLRRFSLPDLRLARVLQDAGLFGVISVETLSVSRVKSGSPAWTCSPSFLCQTETIPLEMDSPTAGILTSMLMNALQYA